MDNIKLKESHFDYKDKIENSIFNKLKPKQEEIVVGFCNIIFAIFGGVFAIKLTSGGQFIGIRCLLVFLCILSFIIGVINLVRKQGTGKQVSSKKHLRQSKKKGCDII